LTTQNLTVRLDRATIRKAKVIAAQRGTSISGLVTDLIDRLVGDEDAYQSAMREALETLDRGYDLGGTHRVPRDELHERAALR
jgi:hypothetical protein